MRRSVTPTTASVLWGAPLTVTINQASGQADPASTSTVLFTAVFSEAVTDFIGADVTVGGTVGGTLSAAVSTSNNITWTVTVSGMATTAGTVTADILAAKVLGIGNQANGASTSTDNSVAWNLPVPVTVDQASTQVDPTTGSTIAFTAVFAEAVAGFTGAGVVISGTAGGTKSATVATTDNITYTITVTGMATSSGTVIVTIPQGGATAVAAPNAGNAVANSTDNTVVWTAPAGSGGGGGSSGGGGGCGLGGGIGAFALAFLLGLRFAFTRSRREGGV